MSKVLQKFIQEEYMSRKTPDFKVGDIVRVHQIVPDIKKGEVKSLSKAAKAIKKTKGDKESGPALRTQIFEGTVIAKKHGREPGATFTVRKIASGNIGVEKIFPLYSPIVEKVEVVSRPTKRVRRAKLYFLRGRVGKKARRLGVGTAVEQEVTSTEKIVTEEDPDGDKNEGPKKQEESVPASQEESEPQPKSIGEEPKADQSAADQSKAAEPESKKEEVKVVEQEEKTEKEKPGAESKK